MSTYDKIAWLPLCGGLTGVGLVLSYLAMRRRGIGSGLRWAAWSLLPLAAYLTGAIEMFWKMGVAIGDFATGFVFSPKVWSGIILAAVSAVLFIASGPLRRRRVNRGEEKQATEPAAGRAGRNAVRREHREPADDPDPKSGSQDRHGGCEGAGQGAQGQGCRRR